MFVIDAKKMTSVAKIIRINNASSEDKDKSILYSLLLIFFKSININLSEYFYKRISKLDLRQLMHSIILYSFN